MSGTDAFFDSNVLLYVTSPDARKASRAEALLISGGTISVQVLNECALAASRKFGASWPEIRNMLEIFADSLTVTSLTIETHRRGLWIAERYRFRVYDSMLLAAALLAGCATFYSEDMQHGQVIDGSLTILDPFA
jgi:predicted nucleic acid-binding protein